MSTIETINVGSSPNDGTGDSLRTSFIICNNNFSYLSSIANVTNSSITANTITVSGNLTAGNISTTGVLTIANITSNLSGNFDGRVGSVTPNVGTFTNVTASNLTVNTTITANIVNPITVSVSGQSTLSDTTINGNLVINQGVTNPISGITTSGLYTITSADYIVIANLAATNGNVYATLPNAANNRGRTFTFRSVDKTASGNVLYVNVASGEPNIFTDITTNVSNTTVTGTGLTIVSSGLHWIQI